MKLTSPSKKEDILTAIITLWKDADKDYTADKSDRYKLGRYTAMLDLLTIVKIYDKEDDT